MIQMVKSKSTKDINLTSCFISCLGNLFGILSCLSTPKLPVMFLINNVIFTILALVYWWLAWKYKSNESRN